MKFSELLSPTHLALKVEYDGSAFFGSQRQLDVRTVQSELEQVLSDCLNEKISTKFSGRTDSGVHALGQVVSFCSDSVSRYDIGSVFGMIDSRLPDDINLVDVASVSDGFDPRRDAVSRTYRYRIVHGRGRSVLSRRTAHVLRKRLDVSSLIDALKLLPLEEIDWAPFAAKMPDHYHTRRRLLSATATLVSDGELNLHFTASGFLYHQVRIMVGALLRVAMNKISISEFEDLQYGEIGSAGPVAPAEGLTLCNVSYPSGLVNWLRSGGEEQFVPLERPLLELAV